MQYPILFRIPLPRFHRVIAAACLIAGPWSLHAREWPAVESLPLRPAISSPSHPDFPDLPDVLRLFDHEAGHPDGEPVGDSLTWRLQRRPEILNMFRHYMYGHEPPPPDQIAFEILSTDPAWLNGTATKQRIQGRIHPMGAEASVSFTFTLYLPNNLDAPPPVLIALNNSGDLAIEPGGSRANRWDLPATLGAGIALITANQAAFSGDSHGSWREPLVDAYEAAGFSGDWQTLAAWAWGIGRLVDYVQSDSRLDRHRIALTGFSRRGKAALWAGMLDQRAALVAPHQGGFAGGSPVRTNWGIGTGFRNSFQYWFLPSFIEVDLSQYDRWPFDGNTALAAVAPRRVFLSQNSSYGASEDGIRAIVQTARPVWNLFGIDPQNEVTWYYDSDSTHQFESYHWQRIHTETKALPLGGERGFRHWMEQQGLALNPGLPLEEALPLDHDHDGRSALAEYFFRSHPQLPDSHPPLQLSRTAGGSVLLHWLRRSDSIGDAATGFRWRGVHQSLQSAPSPNGPWSAVNRDAITPVASKRGPNDSTTVLTVTAPTPATGQPVFYRLQLRLENP